MANANTSVFGHAAGCLSKLLAAFTSQFGHRYAEDAAIDNGVKAKVGFLDTFFHIFNHALIPRLHHDGTSIRRCHRSDFFQADCTTVGVDADTVEHCGRSFAGVEAAEFVERVIDRLLHIGVHRFDDFFWHGVSS